MTRYAILLLSLLLVTVGYGPLLVEHGQNLWAKPHYQHFPFVLVASAILAWRQLRPLDSGGDAASAGRRWFSVSSCVAAWLVLAFAYRVTSPFLAVVSFIMLTGGVGSLISQRVGLRFPTGPWLLLALLLPPPLNLDSRLIESLQRWSSGLASQALDLLGINHLMDGNALVLPTKELFVDEACSGIVSVISIVSCAAIYAVWRQRSAIHVCLLMVTGAGWATLLNVVRITAIALAEVMAGIDWTVGLPHTLVALVAFSAGLVALVATDWLIDALLAEVGPRWALMTGEPIRFGVPLVSLWDALSGRASGIDAESREATMRPVPAFSISAGLMSISLLVSGAFAGLGASQLAFVGRETAEPLVFTDATALIDRLEADLMSKTLCGLRLDDIEHDRRDHTNQFGEHSMIFTYIDDETSASYRVSCDFPYTGGWHELAVCYQGIGWRLDDRRNGTPATSLLGESVGESEPALYRYSQLELTKPDGSHALVTFCACLTGGQAIAPPEYGFLASVGNALAGMRDQGDFQGQQSFQAQVLAVRPEGITDRDRRISAELLDAARERFIAASRDAMASANP